MHLEISKTSSGLVYAISIIPDTDDDIKALTDTESTIELMQENDEVWLEITL